MSIWSCLFVSSPLSRADKVTPQGILALAVGPGQLIAAVLEVAGAARLTRAARKEGTRRWAEWEQSQRPKRSTSLAEYEGDSGSSCKDCWQKQWSVKWPVPKAGDTSLKLKSLCFSSLTQEAALSSSS